MSRHNRDYKLEQAVSEGRREACTSKNGQLEINKVARDDVIKSINYYGNKIYEMVQ